MMDALMTREIGDRDTIREIAGRVCALPGSELDMNTALAIVTAAYECEAQYLTQQGAREGGQAPYDEEEAFDYILDRLMDTYSGIRNDALAQLIEEYIACENDYLEQTGRLTWRALATGA